MKPPFAKFNNDRVQLGIPAAVAVVGQYPPTRHVIGNILVGNQGYDIRSGAIVAAGILPFAGPAVVTVRVTHTQRPARRQKGLAGNVGIGIEDFLQRSACKIITIKTGFGMGEFKRVGKRIFSRGPGIP